MGDEWSCLHPACGYGRAQTRGTTLIAFADGIELSLNRIKEIGLQAACCSTIPLRRLWTIGSCLQTS